MINHTYHLGEEIKTRQIPEIWISRIPKNNRASNEIIKKCKTTIETSAIQSAKQSAKTVNQYVKELEEIIQEAVNIINSTSY